jgi:hypothetical protein
MKRRATLERMTSGGGPGSDVRLEKKANEGAAAPPDEAPPARPPEPPPEPAPPSKSPKSVVTSIDPRIDAATESIQTGDWRKVATELGPLSKAGGLPPTLGLLCALAHHESGSEEDAQAANDLAIRCVASIFGVPREGAIPLVLAKRLLRKNPVAWRARPAPPARLSLLIVLATLAVGSALGWFLSSHALQVLRLKLHL